jgi:hypothetical protein
VIVGQQPELAKVMEKNGKSYGKGNYSDEYLRVLSSPEFKEVRHEALVRAGFRCEECGIYKPTLDAHHHRGYDMLGWEGPDDLRMLCRECHDKAHGRVPIAGIKSGAPGGHGDRALLIMTILVWAIFLAAMASKLWQS